MEKDKELEGLNYTALQLGFNAHKLIGTVKNSLGGNEIDNDIHEDAVWLVAGMGMIKKETPENILQGSLDDTIIVSKKELIEFIKINNSDK